MCFVDLLGRSDWTVLCQIRTKDHDTLPAVLTRQQVHDLLAFIRLRRYRTPLKLIYCCGLRLSECLGLTIHDIRGKENKLLIRNSKGHQDRVLRFPASNAAPSGPSPIAAPRPWADGSLAASPAAAFVSPGIPATTKPAPNAALKPLAEKLATDKGLRAHTNGFTALLHTWNQRMGGHPHIHCLIPGAGLDAHGNPVRVATPEFLVYLPHLQAAFRQHVYRLLKENDWQVDPAVWSKDWGVHIQPAGSGASALKYLGAYIARTAINDARIIEVNDHSLTFRWKNRAHHNRTQTATLPGVEFVERYLRHVLPAGLRSIRYYGFCHPSAKARRMRVQLHTGMAVQFGAAIVSDDASCPSPRCPKCKQMMKLIGSIAPSRDPPGLDRKTQFTPAPTPIAA